jgi:YEATS domain-containing protein 4
METDKNADYFLSTTEDQNEDKGIVRWIVYGSVAELLNENEPRQTSHTHKWKVFVQGFNGRDISHYISHVVFRLHNSFEQPLRRIDNFPWEVNETGWGEFEVAIELHLKDPTLQSITLLHLLKLYPSTTSTTAEINLSHPVISEKFEELVFIQPLTPTMAKALQFESEGNFFSVKSNYDDKFLESQLNSLASARDFIKKELEDNKKKRERVKEMLSEERLLH